ncbi:MAG: hypothetical protein ACE37J_11850 [Pikeienuella sp.]|uniref:hypothetical protein n=1 Tax=Pikeienuella sp. TaxID=2831957 RepID=UPI00391A3959
MNDRSGEGTILVPQRLGSRTREPEPARSDALVAGLFDRLPPPGSVWPEHERRRWLSAAEAIFDLIYPPPDDEPVRPKPVE